MKGKLLFNPTKTDSFTFKGTIELPAGLDLSQPQTLWASLGNVVDMANLTTRASQGRHDDLLKNVVVKYPAQVKKPATAHQRGDEGHGFVHAERASTG